MADNDELKDMAMRIIMGLTRRVMGDEYIAHNQATQHEIDRQIASREGLFIVRLYDGMDNQWIDVSGSLPYLEAETVWNQKTENGTKNIAYDEIDYYKIFPADTKMLYSEGFGER